MRIQPYVIARERKERRQICWCYVATCIATTCCLILLSVVGVLIYRNETVKAFPNVAGSLFKPNWSGSASQNNTSKPLSSDDETITTGSPRRVNHSAISTSPTEHSKRFADRFYCERLKNWRKLAAIKNEEEHNEICCEFYVKQACNETIEPAELRKNWRVCKFGSLVYFYRICVLEEKLPADLRLMESA